MYPIEGMILCSEYGCTLNLLYDFLYYSCTFQRFISSIHTLIDVKQLCHKLWFQKFSISNGPGEFVICKSLDIRWYRAGN